MYHDDINQAFFPVEFIANRIHYLYPIVSDYEIRIISYVGNIQHVTTADITLAVWESVFISGLLNSGYSP